MLTTFLLLLGIGVTATLAAAVSDALNHAQDTLARRRS